MVNFTSFACYLCEVAGAGLFGAARAKLLQSNRRDHQQTFGDELDVAVDVVQAEHVVENAEDKRAGNRADALRIYDDFAAFLRREFDVTPSAETQAVAESLRAT